MRAKGYWIAFAIGVAAGAAVALLYAPQSGVKTRRKLRQSMEDASDYLEETGDYLKAQADRLSAETQAAVKRSRSYIEGAVDSAGDLASTVVKSAQMLV